MENMNNMFETLMFWDFSDGPRIVSEFYFCSVKLPIHRITYKNNRLCVYQSF